MSASLDSGLTFLPAIALQKATTCPRVQGNEVLHGAYSQVDSGRHVYTIETAATRFPNGGETQGLVGLESNRFLLAWVNGESGVMQLISTTARIQAQPLGRDITDRLKTTVGLPQWDPASHKLFVTVSVTNTSRNAIRGPLYLESELFGSVFGELHPVNAFVGNLSSGTVWEIPLRAGETLLAPGETTPETTLRFEVQDTTQSVPSKVGDSRLDLVFRIFESNGR